MSQTDVCLTPRRALGRAVCVWVDHLSVPHRVRGVGRNAGSPLLTVVGEGGQAVPFARVNTHLQVGVRVKEHPLLQTHRSDICTDNSQASVKHKTHLRTCTAPGRRTDTPGRVLSCF